MAVPVVLAAAVGIGAKRFADDTVTVGALHLGVGVLVERRADDEGGALGAHALDEGAA